MNGSSTSTGAIATNDRRAEQRDFNAALSLETGQSDRQRVGLLARQHEREQELVPREDERQKAGRQQAGCRDRHGDLPKGLEPRRSIYPRRLLELHDFALEERHQHPSQERDVDGEVSNDQRSPGIDEAGKLKHRVQWQHQDHRRQHLARQHEETQWHAAGVEPGKRIGHCRRQGQRDHGRADSRHDAVQEVAGKIVLGEDCNEIVRPKRHPLRRQLVGGELVGQGHTREPHQRQKDHRRECHHDHVRQDSSHYPATDSPPRWHLRRPGLLFVATIIAAAGWSRQGQLGTPLVGSSNGSARRNAFQGTGSTHVTSSGHWVTAPEFVRPLTAIGAGQA